MKRPPALPGAACLEPGAAELFGKPGGAPARAKVFCDRCPARPECLAWALDHEPDGIWGGATAHERVKIRRQFGITLEEI